MNKAPIFIILAVFLVALSYLYLAKNQLTSPFPSYEKVVAKIGDKQFGLYVADTQEKRTQGLSNSKKLDINTGMIFYFPVADKHSFWMKNMNYPIDIIFLHDDTVVDIFRNAHPNSYPQTFTPTSAADKVIEVNAGESADIEKGMKVIFD